MSEIVERVAKAILAGHDWTHDDGNDPSLPTGWEAVPPDWRDAYRAMARAAIEAMREPTADMFKHAMPHMDSWSSNAAWWQKMIDGALK